MKTASFSPRYPIMRKTRQRRAGARKISSLRLRPLTQFEQTRDNGGLEGVRTRLSRVEFTVAFSSRNFLALREGAV